jgi:hypothetical protein
MDRLRHMDYYHGRQTELETAGALLADFCAAEPLRWEGFARFTACYHAHRETREDFVNLLGPSAEVSKALADWAKAHAR